MIHCRDRITPEQNKTLQSYKDNAQDFDSTQSDYAALLNFSLDKYKYDDSVPVETQQGPVDMTQEESMMQTIVEVSKLQLDKISFKHNKSNSNLNIGDIGLERGDEERKRRRDEEHKRSTFSILLWIH